MKFYKFISHLLITLGSITAFLLGWASLAHSLKPLQPIPNQILAPLKPIGINAPNTSSNGLFQFYSGNTQQNTGSMFMSRGS
jgi:hypothetical protein